MATMRATGLLQGSGNAIVDASISTVEQHTGPLPHPDTLRQYDELKPGLAERIVVMAESQAAHRQDMEKRLLSLHGDDTKAQRREIARGQYCALAVCIAVIACAGIAAVYGLQIAAVMLGAGGLSSVIGSFIVTERQKAAEGKGTALAKAEPKG
jgi:uncharacterized membrane protein